MSNYDELFTASTEKNESKQERPFNKEEWIAKKQQERAEAFEMLDAATTEAVSNPETFRDYLLMQSRFGKYSVSNALLIAYQNNEATYLADFDTWKEAYSCKRVSALSHYLNPATSLPVRTARRAFPSM